MIKKTRREVSLNKDKTQSYKIIFIVMKYLHYFNVPNGI